MDIRKNNFFNLIDIVNKHDAWMDETINLIASENRMSPLIAEVLKSDFGNRVAEGWIGERVFPGIKYYDEIEKYGMDLVCDMFHAEFADIRPISGTMANMIVFSAFTKPGDTIASISISSGAHVSMAGATPRKVFGLKVVEIPFDYDNFTIDIDRAVEVIRSTRPKIIVFGGSVLLFSQPIKKLKKICKEVDAIILFDAAHVAGLIAAEQYPNPFHDGADIVTMTLCKTIPGPQHAIILSRNEFANYIKKATFPGFLSRHHLHETVASVLALEEFKIFGKDYARQVLLNAKALAGYLSNCGFNVFAANRGFTETHMMLVDISNEIPADEAEKILENANIIVNRNMLPKDSSFLKPSGLRIGTPEITRIGFKERDMAIIASFMKRLLLDKDNPYDIKKEVTQFRKSFKSNNYCYEKGNKKKIDSFLPHSEKYKNDFFIEKYAALWAYGYRNSIGQSEGLYRTINELGFSCLDSKENYSILDVGCGMGRTASDYAKFFKNSEVIGIDNARPMIDMANRINNTEEVVNLDMSKIGLGKLNIRGEKIGNLTFYNIGIEDVGSYFSKKRFDVITAVNFIDRVVEIRKSIENIFKLLKDGGIFILSTPLNFLDVRSWNNYGSFHSLEKLVLDVGFMVDVKFDGLIYREMLDARGATEEYPTVIMRLIKK